MRIPTHSTAEKIASWPTDELSAGEFANILGIGAHCISTACQKGLIETLQIHVRDKAERKHRRNTYRITKAAALKYIWANTSGDRAQLRAALDQICPHLLKVWESEEASAKSTQPLPANVIALPTAKAPKIRAPRPGDMVQTELFAHA